MPPTRPYGTALGGGWSSWIRRTDLAPDHAGDAARYFEWRVECFAAYGDIVRRGRRRTPTGEPELEAAARRRKR